MEEDNQLKNLLIKLNYLFKLFLIAPYNINFNKKEIKLNFILSFFNIIFSIIIIYFSYKNVKILYYNELTLNVFDKVSQFNGWGMHFSMFFGFFFAVLNTINFTKYLENFLKNSKCFITEVFSFCSNLNYLKSARKLIKMHIVCFIIMSITSYLEYFDQLLEHISLINVFFRVPLTLFAIFSTNFLILHNNLIFLIFYKLIKNLNKNLESIVKNKYKNHNFDFLLCDRIDSVSRLHFELCKMLIKINNIFGFSNFFLILSTTFAITIQVFAIYDRQADIFSGETFFHGMYMIFYWLIWCSMRFWCYFKYIKIIDDIQFLVTN